MGGAFVCVNLACLDDTDPAELAAVPVRYEDGANDDWESAPVFFSHLHRRHGAACARRRRAHGLTVRPCFLHGLLPLRR